MADVIIPVGTDPIDGVAHPGVNPGDTVWLTGGAWGKTSIQNWHGNPGDPIYFRPLGAICNFTGAASWYVMLVTSCDYIDIGGDGLSGVDYGIVLNEAATTAGLFLWVNAEHLAVHHIEITSVNIGCHQDHSAEGVPVTRTGFDLHNFYTHDVLREGFYLGVAGGYNLADVEVHHSITENTGWDGIQWAECSGTSSIHHNQVIDAGTLNVANQRDGILPQSATTVNAEVYNNVVLRPRGHGVFPNNAGAGTKIYNNLIVDAGTGVAAQGVRINSNNQNIYENTIVDTNGWAITIAAGAGCVCTDNLMVGNSAGGISGACGGSNNITSATGHATYFVDAPGGDYHLKAGCNAIDGGISPPYPLGFDLDDELRPRGLEYDVGAYEFTFSTGMARAVPGAGAVQEIPWATVNLMRPFFTPGWRALEEVVLAAPGTVTFLGIPDNYRTLALAFEARSDDEAEYDYMILRFNNDAGANYDWGQKYGRANNTFAATGATGANEIRIAQIEAANATASAFTPGVIYIQGYRWTTNLKVAWCSSGVFGDVSVLADIFLMEHRGRWGKTPPEAVARVDLLPLNGANFTAYSRFTLYGIL